MPDSFQITPLPNGPFEHLFLLDDADLARRGISRRIADSTPGFPCRVSLEDALVGDELLLLPFEHQPAASPYRAAGPIFVKRGARPANMPVGVVPPYVTRRLISMRAYDDADWIVEACVAEGTDVAQALHDLFGNPAVQYVHLHNAKRGCYSCKAVRA